MRLVPRHWNNETWVCSIRGHVTPAAQVRTLRATDRGLGFDDDNDQRFVRCVRCDAWIDMPLPPPNNEQEHLPDIDNLTLPRRGKALEEAILLRVIAIDRAIHSIGFTLLAIGLALIEVNLSAMQRFGADLATRLDGAVAETGQQASRSFVSRSLHELLTLRRGAIEVLLVTAIAYAILEGVEAVGLWRERRWAEYLTVIATVGFLPFELIELSEKVTVFRLGALVVNIAVLIWLLWAKRLFGLRGGVSQLEKIAQAERAEIISSFRS